MLVSKFCSVHDVIIKPISYEARTVCSDLLFNLAGTVSDL